MSIERPFVISGMAAFDDARLLAGAGLMVEYVSPACLPGRQSAASPWGEVFSPARAPNDNYEVANVSAT
jgi:hypothetical protein